MVSLADATLMTIDDNDILRRIPGNYIGSGQLTLPPPETAPTDPMSVVADVEHVGRVRIHYERRLVRHHKSSHWAWLVYRAEAEP